MAPLQDAGVKLSLDCAQAEFLTPERAVISLKGGELYVLSLLVDGMRCVLCRTGQLLIDFLTNLDGYNLPLT